MDLQSGLKASLLALTLLCMVTWVPHMYSSLRTFFLVSLPSAASTATAPKCLFVFSNVIVVFLISESKLARSSARGSSDDGDLARGDTVRGQQENVVKAVMSRTTTEESSEVQEGSVIVEPEDNAVLVHEGVHKQIGQYQDDVGVVVGAVKESRELREEGSVEGQEEAREEEEYEEEDGEPADELNRRVEDFIARFNMERQLEARMLVCCC